MKKTLCSLLVLLLAYSGLYAQQVLYVSPSGSASNSGTSISAPTTLANALATVTAGGTIYMRGGTYSFSSTIVIAESNSGTASAPKNLFAYNGEVPVLNFSAMAVSSSNRGVILDGSYWHLKGLIIESAGDNGMLLSGDNNTIESCIFRKNADTGLQLSRYNTSYTTISQWPSNNLILSCEAYDNQDPGNENADGFAAKLTCGAGNIFRNCISHNNIDDGWDLYTKPDTGPIGPVTLEGCISYSNGVLTDGSTSGSGDKNGFKLGGEDIAVNHIVRRCVAFNNGHHGFTYNSNPGTIEVTNNTSYNNAQRNFNFDGGTSVFKNNLSYLSGSNDRIIGTATAPNAFQGVTGSLTVSASDFVTLTPGPTASPTSNGFLNLAAGSHLIDAGVTTTGITYNGSAPDIGAIEYGGTTTTGYTLTTSVSPSGGGSITRNPDGTSYTAGTVVTLTAVAASGYTFTGWSGGASGTSTTTTVTMNVNTSVTANFTASSGTTTLRIDDKSGTGTGYCSVDGSRSNSYSGADGGYYVNLTNSSGKGITWAVNAASAGTYTIRWRYANAGSQSATTARVLVNGTEVVAAASFPKTASWTTWTTTDWYAVTLVAGANKIRLETTASSEFANIDWIEINGNNPAEALCSAATGTRIVTQTDEPVTGLLTEEKPVIIPNPSRGVSSLRFVIASKQKVSVRMFAADGRLIKVIANGEFAEGLHTLPVEYNGLQQGVYFIAVSYGGKQRLLQNLFIP